MPGYPPDSVITVQPYSHRREADSAVIGDLDRQVFLSVPVEALDVLEWFAQGCTPAEASRRYEAKHGETADLDDFIDVMVAEGFITVNDGAAGPVAAPDPLADGSAPPDGGARRNEASKLRWKSHMEWISQRTAQRIFSAAVLAACGLVIAAGVLTALLNPGIIPGATILLFPEHFALLTWSTMAIMIVGIYLHEVAHLVAARAAGIPARIGIGTRLYILVAETDMSGIWLASKRQRYLAFLAGPIVDGVFGSFAIILLKLMENGTLSVPQEIRWLTAAALWTYFGRLLWQCFFFMHTDFYYVITTAIGTRNLIKDTEKWMGNLVRRLFRSPKRADLSDLSPRELNSVRWYSAVYLLGRGVTLASLFAITLPVLIGYLSQAFLFLTGQDSRINSFDFATIVLVAVMLDGGGLYLSIRNLFRRRRARRAELALRDDRLATARAGTAGS
ncbi:M50 family metallopeptidase [Streptomyces sp. C10-9-1]|uniref:M50 family metallopeptidase n=1 Tax=Streptomyces sp. C10-9-1 TaxID=1859285 RepID=UPI0021133263|nr:M50 family metallopeptidase [Streptomyces sp. C10-9-1]MCQ6552214.1 M50 family metallopeptidase [Streptomyces sp. C10-9-1]